VEYTNKQRISNALEALDKGCSSARSWRIIGYIEALLQTEGVLNIDSPLPRANKIVKGFFRFYAEKESSFECIERIARNHVRGE
jgi:hypothetical protein